MGAAAQRGFSLVELLVVVLILGLLAAIAIPRYINQQDKARGAEAKAAARTASLAMEAYSVQEHGYTGVTVADLEQEEHMLADADLRIDTPPNAPAPDGDSYQLRVVAPTSDPIHFIVRRAAGTTLRTCTYADGTPADTAGCKAGSW